MKDQRSKKSCLTAKNLWRAALVVLLAAAIVQELRKPTDKRTWHGEVAGLMPYDLRKPTMERVRAASWNPEGPILTQKAWGLGWTLNFGAIKKALGF